MDSTKFHIIYILRSFPTVTEMSTLNEITGMARRGMQVSIVSLKKPPEAMQVHDDVRNYQLLDNTYYLNVSTGIKKWKNIILRTIYGQVKLFLDTDISFKNKLKVSLYSLKKKIRRLSLVHLVDLINHIAEKKPDVIYFHFATHAGELIILRKIFRIPFIVFFHGFDFSKEQPFDELNYPEMFRYGDWFFTNSNFAGMKVESLGCPKEKLSVVGLPVDDHQYPYVVRKKKEKIRLLTVGRLVEKKGLQYSIEAVSRLLKKFPDLEYNIIGDGPLEPSLIKQIHESGADGHIHLLGSRKKAEVIDYMLTSDIFVLASVTAKDGETEGLPMVSLESQLTGMPIVATLHSGFTDSVLEGSSGFLVPEHDVNALYDRLLYLIENPGIWEEFGKAGREHIMKNFSESVYMERIIGKLIQLIIY
jgi:colanic acid/amylovoran biosynthesis glycosyltransferase